MYFSYNKRDIAHMCGIQYALSRGKSLCYSNGGEEIYVTFPKEI